jgi:hypothetical protein
MLISLCIALALASTSYGMVIGNWESSNADGWATNGTMTFTNGNANVFTGAGWQYYMWLNTGNQAIFDALAGGAKLSVTFSIKAADWDTGTDWGQKALEETGSLVLKAPNGPAGWWTTISPESLPDFGNGANGVWKSEDGDVTATYVYDVPAQGVIPRGGGNDFVEFGFISGGDVADVMGPFIWQSVTLTPEPATMALLGLGGLALIRRKK